MVWEMFVFNDVSFGYQQLFGPVVGAIYSTTQSDRSMRLQAGLNAAPNAR